MSKRGTQRNNEIGNMSENSKISQLHIPRASLSDTTSSRKSSSTIQSREFSPAMNLAKQKIHAKLFSNEFTIFGTSSDQIKSPFDGNPISYSGKKMSTSSCNNKQKYLVHKAPKPSSLHSLSSASSSLSTGGSEQSNYSTDNMLLSVKNLENFNQRNSEIYNQSDFDHREQMLANIKNILAVDENLTTTITTPEKKEVDQLSTASTATNTNFTVINFNGFNKEHKKSRSICRRRHQVTLVIVVMTIFLFFGIFSAVCMLEMRYKKMPR